MSKNESRYYYATGGTFGNAYSKHNVKPYDTIWRDNGKSRPVCVYHNVTGVDDPCIRKYVRDRLLVYNYDTMEYVVPLKHYKQTGVSHETDH